MQLRELQQIFLRRLYQGEDCSSATSLVQPLPGRSAAEQYAVVQGSVLGNLTQALTRVYPVCCRLVGVTPFERLALRYLRQHPSQSPDLHDFGRAFPDFLATFQPVLQTVPYLPDVAAFEWAWHCAFHGLASPAFDFAALAALSEDQQQSLCFSLAPSLALLQSPYPIHRIWQANQPGVSEELSLQEDEALHLVIWRPAWIPEYAQISSDQARILHAVQQGLALSEWIDPTLASLLPSCIERGWITGFEEK